MKYRKEAVHATNPEVLAAGVANLCLRHWRCLRRACGRNLAVGA